MNKTFEMLKHLQNQPAPDMLMQVPTRPRLPVVTSGGYEPSGLDTEGGAIY